ncbi:MAG: TetR/AcrR family transcriptional regulator [Gammaproteobacteria bacterium]|jgi:AcrR family transcriptional regulator|nr:TetR/AcrR family transcriptional regulator [Gammaproteobacteria bacterium]
MQANTKNNVTQQSTGNPRTITPKKIELLEAARHALASRGHSNFSMRSVAREAGIHLKTLQHYFPNKQSLLTEVLEYTLRSYYFNQFNLMFDKRSDLGAEEKFRLLIDYVLDDLGDPFTASFFPEIWALASRDPDASLAMDRFYTLYRNNIEELIFELNPKLDGICLIQRAAIIAMAGEGMLLLVGHNKPKHRELKNIKNEFVNRMLDIVRAPLDANCASN